MQSFPVESGHRTINVWWWSFCIIYFFYHIFKHAQSVNANKKKMRTAFVSSGIKFDKCSNPPWPHSYLQYNHWSMFELSECESHWFTLHIVASESFQLAVVCNLCGQTTSLLYVCQCSVPFRYHTQSIQFRWSDIFTREYSRFQRNTKCTCARTRTACSFFFYITILFFFFFNSNSSNHSHNWLCFEKKGQLKKGLISVNPWWKSQKWRKIELNYSAWFVWFVCFFWICCFFFCNTLVHHIRNNDTILVDRAIGVVLKIYKRQF